jgi:hypothetical protein
MPDTSSPREAPPGLPRSPAHAKTARCEGRWLVVSNCVNIGLAHCLKLQAPRLEVECIDFGRFRKDAQAWSARLGEYDRIVTTSQFARSDLAQVGGEEGVRVLPLIQFDAYHPDLCWLTDDAGFVKGPLGDYHSQIVTAAYFRGLSVGDARARFTHSRFEQFGFLDRWVAARDRLLGEFRAAGLPLDRYYPAWSARGPFMHSVNHPAIHVIYDVASALLEAEGRIPVRAAPMPHDNLLNGSIFPIYPEIADRLSVRGSYLFKLPAQYRCIDLDEFISGSYAALDALGGKVEVHQVQRTSYERVMAAL